MGKVADDIGDGIRNVVGAVGEFLTELGNSIFGTQKKTVTDIQVQTLLTPGDASRNARKSAYRGAAGKSSEYSQGYNAFKRQYKKTFRASTFKSLGYQPNSTATTRTVLPSLVESYIEGLYGYANVSVSTVRDTYLTSIEKCNYGRQQLVGYDFATGTLVDGGKTYLFSTCTESTETTLGFLLTREYEETILDNLTTNYSYDAVETTVVIAGELYGVGAISPVVVNGNYTTVCTHLPKEYVSSTITAESTGGIVASIQYLDDADSNGVVYVDELTGSTLNLLVTPGVGAVVGDELVVYVDGAPNVVTITQDILNNGYNFSTSTFTTAFETQLPDETILTPIETITRSYSNVLFDDEVTYVAYVVTSGEVPNTTRYYIAAADTLPIYTIATVEVSPILTLKKDFVIVNPDNTNLANAMKRFGLGGQDFTSSLSQSGIHSAYLLMGANPTINNSHHAKIVFQMFDLMTAGNGNVTISIDNLNLKYSFTIIKSTHTGIVAPVGFYTKAVHSGTTMTLRYQGSTNQYQQIYISNFLQTYTVAGRNNSAYLDDPDGECRLIIPLDLLNNLRYNDWVDVYERSLCLVVYAQQTVELDWYEQAWFGFVLQIIGLVITVLSLGTMSWVNVLIAVAINAALKFTLEWIVENVGGELGAFLAAVLTVIAVIYLGNLSSISTTAGWLGMASSGLTTLSQAYQHHLALELAELQSNEEAYMQKMKEKHSELEEKIKEQEESKSRAYDYAQRVFKEFDTIGSPNPMFQTIEGYVSSIVNTEWLVDGSWMYDIDRQVRIRQQPYVGV